MVARGPRGRARATAARWGSWCAGWARSPGRCGPRRRAAAARACNLRAHADDFFQASAARHAEQVRNWAEVRTQQLPAFLEAFAQLLNALPAADAYAMKTLHELLKLLLRQFGALVPIQRRRNAGALQLLLALLDKGGALEQLLGPRPRGPAAHDPRPCLRAARVRRAVVAAAPRPRAARTAGPARASGAGWRA